LEVFHFVQRYQSRVVFSNTGCELKGARTRARVSIGNGSEKHPSAGCLDALHIVGWNRHANIGVSLGRARTDCPILWLGYGNTMQLRDDVFNVIMQGALVTGRSHGEY
jgi:hypothetical protein